MFDTVVMLIILGLVLKKRGNWIAVVFTVSYTVGYFIKGLSFNSWVNNDGNGAKNDVSSTYLTSPY